jgi:Protein of unknown function (DUF3828)
VRAAKARIFAICLSVGLLPFHGAAAKAPEPTDEAAVREIVAKIYAPYSQPIPEAPEDGGYAPDNAAGASADGYEPPYTQSLGALIGRWDRLMQESEELYGLNGFDWYCQCQDNDPATSRLVRQSYTAKGKDAIEAKVLFSPGRYEGKDMGAPLLFRFKREGGQWKIDDLRFQDSDTLRKGLADDIKVASKKP